MRKSERSPIVRFARTHHRDIRNVFGIRQSDRLSHMYIVGKTGTGKTTLIHTLLADDIRNFRGCALLDPHGDLAEEVVHSQEAKKRAGLRYVDIANPNCRASYNPLAKVSSELRPLVASGLLDVFRMMWSDAWGTRMEHVLRNALLALLDQPYATLPDILRLLTDETYRATAAEHIQNPQVKRFWTVEFEAYGARYRADSAAPIQSKIGALLADPRLYRFFTGRDEPLRLRRVMGRGDVLVVNLSKGRLGADSARLVGGILTTMLSVSAFSRADLSVSQRRPFFIYLDEFQTFTTLAVAEMMAELRKMAVGIVASNQFLNQTDPRIRQSVLGNAGTLISFRVGAEDAAYLAKEFEPKFSRLDLLNLPNHHIYLRLLIDGAPSKPFSATTLTPHEATRHRHEA